MAVTDNPPKKRTKPMSNRNLVFTSTIAALYFVLTVALAPVSYGPIQFRVSEFLKFFALFNPWTGLGLAIGDILSALNSPFVGPWELIWMPLTDLAGAVVVFYIFRMTRRKEWMKYILMAFYAVTTGLSVALMLYALGVDLFLPLALSVSASEIIILILSIPVGNVVMTSARARNFLENG